MVITIKDSHQVLQIKQDDELRILVWLQLGGGFIDHNILVL
jgi:hypothetical protein